MENFEQFWTVFVQDESYDWSENHLDLFQNSHFDQLSLVQWTTVTEQNML